MALKELVVDALNYGTVLLQLALLVLLVAYIFRKRVRWAHNYVSFVREHGILLAAIIASIAMAGSLYFSQVMKWTPCLLCWYQRIAIFPMVFVLWGAYAQKYRKIVFMTIPLAIVGLLIAAYHWALQLLPIDASTVCVTAGGVSCVGRYIYHFGYLTIAGMAVTTLTAIIVVLLLQYRKRN